MSCKGCCSRRGVQSTARSGRPWKMILKSGSPSASVLCVAHMMKAIRSRTPRPSALPSCHVPPRQARWPAASSAPSSTTADAGMPKPRRKVSQNVVYTIDSSSVSDAREVSFLRPLMRGSNAGRSSCPSATGTTTFLVSFTTASTTEICELAPSSSSSSGGVTTTPRRLPITALNMASASLPPADRVIATHMLTVVGTAAIASRPSRSADGMTPRSGSVRRNMANGRKARLKVWMAACSRTRKAASASSDVGSVSPESRKMPHVAPQPTVSSGRSGPPVQPTLGAIAAIATAIAAPARK
mmetsp:Transcript_39497/g.104246  ORF Transcript_39497/g.104246 Transcript_39497/m.104246 type:complete len:299 (-) Transcript_39497:279-1175(-)